MSDAPVPRTPARGDGDAMSSGVRESLHGLQDTKTEDRHSQKITAHSRTLEDEMRREAKHVQAKIKKLQDALRTMTSTAAAGGIEKKLLLKIVGRLDNDMAEFVSVLVDPKATPIHRCQAGFGYFILVVCVMMILVMMAGGIGGQVPAMQCLPWWMGFGNHEACLKWHDSRCPYGCAAANAETCSGSCIPAVPPCSVPFYPAIATAAAATGGDIFRKDYLTAPIAPRLAGQFCHAFEDATGTSGSPPLVVDVSSTCQQCQERIQSSQTSRLGILSCRAPGHFAHFFSHYNFIKN